MKEENEILKSKILELKSAGKKRNEILQSLGLSLTKYYYLLTTDAQRENVRSKLKIYREKLAAQPYAKLIAKVKYFQYKGFCETPFTAEDVIKKYGENPVCYLTGLPIDYNDSSTYQLDHFIPLASGGLSSLENLRLCHPIANAMKRDFSLEVLLKFSKLIVEHNEYKERRSFP